jgi:phosphatidylinositol alpha-mannosyltransferase
VLRTIRALRDEDFDVVHLHEPLAPGPTLTSVVFTSAPTIGTFHAAGTSAAYLYLRPLTRWLGRRLSIRCAVSEDARAMAARALGGDYVLVHNGIDIERFAKASPWPTEAPTVLFLSRHESRKGLEVLLDSLPHLPGDVQLWIASDGPDTARLRAKVANEARVHWLGRITEEEKAQRLRTADVLCAPSLGGESFGMVLLEGMAAHTAIVASDLPGYSNVARHEKEALLVTRGDPRALAAAIRRVLDEPQLAASLIAGGEARAAEFSMDRLADRYIELYQRAMESSGLEIDHQA